MLRGLRVARVNSPVCGKSTPAGSDRQSVLHTCVASRDKCSIHLRCVQPIHWPCVRGQVFDKFALRLGTSVPYTGLALRPGTSVSYTGLASRDKCSIHWPCVQGQVFHTLALRPGTSVPYTGLASRDKYSIHWPCVASRNMSSIHLRCVQGQVFDALALRPWGAWLLSTFILLRPQKPGYTAFV